MEFLLDFIEQDNKLLIGGNHLQELYLHLHLLGIYSMPTLAGSFNRVITSSGSRGLMAWKDIPPILCITLKVPRAKLGIFTELPRSELGTPPLHCTFQANNDSLNIFSILQLSFGKISTSGMRNSADFQVHVAEDNSGWNGKSPLVVSFYVPTWVALLEPEKGQVTLGLQSTPQTLMTFMKALGVEMNVYKAQLWDKNSVYITAHRPNQAAYPYIPGQTTPDANALDNTASISAKVDRKAAKVISFTGRIDLVSEDVKSSLKNQAEVRTLQILPCVVEIIIGSSSSSSHSYGINFPAPVICSQSKTRIARKSFYIEVVVPMVPFSAGEIFPDFMYPLFLEVINRFFGTCRT